MNKYINDTSTSDIKKKIRGNYVQNKYYKSSLRKYGFFLSKVQFPIPFKRKTQPKLPILPCVKKVTVIKMFS